MFGADQTERVLGAPRAGEEHFRQARRIDGVGGSLRGQERRAPGRKLKRADAGGLRDSRAYGAGGEDCKERRGLAPLTPPWE